MKKSLLSLAVLSAVSFGAYADGVELYGILDVAVGDVAHQLNGDSTFPATVNPVSAISNGSNLTITKSGGSTTGVNYGVNTFQGMMNGGIQDSRWGIKGTEGIGDGLKAIFTLESGIDLNSGQLNNGIAALGDSAANSANTSLNGQLFNRQAWFGLSDQDMGQLTFGRQYAPGYDLFAKYDPVQFAQLFSPLGFSGGLGGGMGISENLRQDNSLKYSNTSGNLKYGVMYKFGNQAGNNNFNQGYGFNFDYTMGNLSVGGVYQLYKDALKTTGGGTTASVEAFNTKGWIVSAKYKLNDSSRISAGIEHYALQTANDAITTTSVSSFYGYTVSTAISYTGTDQGVTVSFFGGDIDLTSNLNVAAGYYHVSLDAYFNNTTASGVVANLSVPSGDQSFISLLADYRLSKRTDVYAGAMVANYAGAQGAGNQSTASYYNNNSIVALGLRHKF